MGLQAARPEDREEAGPWPVTMNQAPLLARRELFVAHGRQAHGVNRVDVATLDGPLDVDGLAAALARVVRRHGGLRSAFRPNHRMPDALRHHQLAAFRQTGICDPALYEHVVGPPGQVSFVVSDHTALDPGARREYVSSLVSDQYRTPFVPAAPPHLRVHLVRFAPTAAALIVATPWLASDEASQNLLWADIAAHYRAAVTGAAAPEPAPQFHELAAWQAEQLDTTYFAECEEYWREVWDRFEDAQLGIGDVPGAGTSRPEAMLEGDLLVVPTGQALAEAVRAFAAAARVSPSVVFLAGYVALLNELTDRPRVTLWMALPNRCRDETEPVVGWLSNFHLLGFDVERARPALGLLETCRSRLVMAQAHQELPLGLLWRRVGRVAERFSPQIVFEWRTAATFDGGNVRLMQESAGSTAPAALAGLHLTVTKRPVDYALGLAYAVRHFNRPTIDHQLSRYQQIIWRIVSAPEAALAAP